MKDFTRPKKPPIEFSIDDDVFLCTPEVTVGAATQLAQMANEKNDMQRMLMLGELLDLIMFPASAQLFIARMRNPENPITNEQLGDVLEWLMEQYGERPTRPSPASSSGGSDTGTESTAGVQLVG